jgi:hypothetical protein
MKSRDGHIVLVAFAVSCLAAAGCVPRTPQEARKGVGLVA